MNGMAPSSAANAGRSRNQVAARSRTRSRTAGRRSPSISAQCSRCQCTAQPVYRSKAWPSPSEYQPSPEYQRKHPVDTLVDEPVLDGLAQAPADGRHDGREQHPVVGIHVPAVDLRQPGQHLSQTVGTERRDEPIDDPSRA